MKEDLKQGRCNSGEWANSPFCKWLNDAIATLMERNASGGVMKLIDCLPDPSEDHGGVPGGIAVEIIRESLLEMPPDVIKITRAVLHKWLRKPSADFWGIYCGPNQVQAQDIIDLLRLLGSKTSYPLVIRPVIDVSDGEKFTGWVIAMYGRTIYGSTEEPIQNLTSAREIADFIKYDGQEVLTGF